MRRIFVSGERNPHQLAQLADRRIKSSPQELEAALTGNYREEMVFILHQELSLYEFYQQQIALLEEEIEKCLAQFPSVTESAPPVTKKKARRPKDNPPFDLRSHLYRITGVDFTTIDGLDVVTVETIISEVGLDPTKFKTVKHFASWLGLSPGCRITGGRVKSAQTRKKVFKDLLPHLKSNWHKRKQRPLPESVQFTLAKFEKIWIIDGSTLEALFKKLKSLQDIPQGQLAGKMGSNSHFGQDRTFFFLFL